MRSRLHPSFRSASLVLALSAACARPAPVPKDGVVAPPTVDLQPIPVIDRVALRAELADHRARQIAHLHAYGQAGQFPHNVTTAPSLHMFRDPEARLCAVANLIETDGRDDLVEATVRTQNDLAIADVHDGAMMGWIERSGLTQEELVRIQLPAPVITRPAKPLRPQPTNVAARTLSPEEEMNAAVAKHVAEVEAELRMLTSRSLDAAVERYARAHGSV